jgi:hypothetical protein
MRILEGCPSAFLADVTLCLISEQGPTTDEPDLIFHHSRLSIPGIPSDVVGQSKMSSHHLFFAFWAFHAVYDRSNVVVMCRPDPPIETKM